MEDPAQLTIIYFVDSKKTKSFKLPLIAVRWILLGLFLVFLWSITSLVWLYDNFSQNRKLIHSIQEFKSIIFEYQSRYDDSYGIAYPEDKPQIINDKKTEDVLKTISSNSKSDAKINFKEIYEKNQKAELEVNLKIEEDIPWLVKVEDPILYKQKNQKVYELNFAIKNTNKNAKSEGYIWAVAAFANYKGEKFYMGSPAGIKLDQEGDLVSLKSDLEYYNIRYFKSKSLKFKIPDEEKAFIVEITIHLMDKDNNKVTIKLPVENEIEIKNLPLKI